jgi:hypothetical protein
MESTSKLSKPTSTGDTSMIVEAFSMAFGKTPSGIFPHTSGREEG